MSLGGKKKIAVIMSIYNGREYLDEQLLSLACQVNVLIDLYVRNDNFKDDCLDILSKYKKYFSNLFFFDGDQNLGFAESFYFLSLNSGDYDYYAFCDQDDIWCSNKLLKAINYLDKFSNKVPVLYCGNFVSFSNEEPISINKYKKISNWENYFYSFCPGCTMVFNKTMMNYFRTFRPNKILYHDQWLLFLCLCLSGNVFYSTEITTWYRQHKNNLIGYKRGILQRFINFKNYFKKDCSFIFDEISYVCGTPQLFKLISQETSSFFKKVLNYKSSFKNKIILLKSNEIKSFTLKFRLKFLFLVIFERL